MLKNNCRCPTCLDAWGVKREEVASDDIQAAYDNVAMEESSIVDVYYLTKSPWVNELMARTHK